MSLSVNVGRNNDPTDVPGLSGLLKRALFAGSEKYKGENEYSSYIQKNQGSCSSITELYYTTFGFEIANEHFHVALDMYIFIPSH